MHVLGFQHTQLSPALTSSTDFTEGPVQFAPAAASPAAADVAAGDGTGEGRVALMTDGLRFGWRSAESVGMVRLSAVLLRGGAAAGEVAGRWSMPNKARADRKLVLNRLLYAAVLATCDSGAC